MHSLLAYDAINRTLLGLVIIVFAYSFIFYPDRHPIKCKIYEMTKKPCASCGLSRSLSAMTHGDIEAARNLNKHGIVVFYFFIAQFIIRVTTLLYSHFSRSRIGKWWMILDGMTTIISFLFVFLPFLGKN